MFNRLTVLLMVLVYSVYLPTASTGDDKPGKENEKALAVYADAANFLNNGAHALAIEQWERFLKEFPNDPLAGKASHYLGVSLMQKDAPDYIAAARSFDRALNLKGFDMREEALANRAWCLYTAGRAEEKDLALRNELLQTGVKTYEVLLREYPQTKHAPQALFFSGEAEYVMERREQAIGFYQRLLQAAPKDSPLRCDAMYAEGVAREELGQADEALKVYAQLLASCADGPLVAEVLLRRGELFSTKDQLAEASAEFGKAVEKGGDLADYAQYRLAASLLLMGKNDEAGSAYLALVQKFPESQYVNSAKLAAAQSFFQAGKFERAAPMFKVLLTAKDSPTAIEAAHWLAQIALRGNKPSEVIPLAEETLKQHPDAAPYREALQLDIADALVALGKSAEALKAFAVVYENTQDESLAGRSLYGAAFTALQGKQSQEALNLANRFLKRFPNDMLTPDAAYVAAEAKLQGGSHQLALDAYDKLLSQVKEHPSREIWLIRSITAAYLGGKYDQAAKRAREALPKLLSPRDKAEANYLLGGSELLSNRPKEAIAPLTLAASVKEFNQADEATLLLGQAQAAAGDPAAAKKSWQSVISNFPKSAVTEQAHYRIGQLLALEKDFAGAQKHYDAIIAGGLNEGLKAYASYGKGWTLMQMQDYQAAVPPLDHVLKNFPQHPSAKDALLARGISLRHLDRNEEAGKDLRQFLETNPDGNDLGHALYELALIDLAAKRSDEATQRFRQIVEKVPEYPSLDKVLYELAWSLKDAEKEEDAAKTFEQLTAKFPQSPLAPEANYHIGQQRYTEGKWAIAAEQFKKAASSATDPVFQEKAQYKLGWALFQDAKYQPAVQAFNEQLKKFPKGELALDGKMMVGECLFKESSFKEALAAYRDARKIIEQSPAPKEIDPQEQQVRELILLHGGQCEQQLENWKGALEWFSSLRERYPNTRYLAQVFYETGFCYQNLNQPAEAIKFYSQVAENYRTEVAARARFMMGEIYFGQREPARAIPEFQRVMLGFGADKAPEEIKNWQGKAGYEAGRCAELLIQPAAGDARVRAVEISREFYQYVLDKHPQHELVGKARERLDVLRKL